MPDTNFRTGSSTENAMTENQHVILCVDDESVGLRIRKLLLERAGYSVLTAPDGPSGIEIFARQHIDAVVLDYFMPGMDGGEVAAKMREAKPQIPILLLSAYLGLPKEVTALVDIYMTKGEGAPILLQNVTHLLALRKNRVEARSAGTDTLS